MLVANHIDECLTRVAQGENSVTVYAGELSPLELRSVRAKIQYRSMKLNIACATKYWDSRLTLSPKGHL